MDDTYHVALMVCLLVYSRTCSHSRLLSYTTPWVDSRSAQTLRCKMGATSLYLDCSPAESWLEVFTVRID